MRRNRRTTRRVLATIAASFYAAHTCLGQAPAPETKQGTAAAAPAARSEVLPDHRIGYRVAPVLLVTRVDVQSELKMTAEQSASAFQTAAYLQDKAGQLRGRTDAEAARAQAEINRAGSSWASEHLSGEQQARLAQLDLQWEGPSSLLTRPKVAEILRLDDAQRKALSKLIAERNSKRHGGPASATDELALFNGTVALLSPEQKQAWRAILGPMAPFQAAIHPQRAETMTR